jgi:hypothetical protein
MKYKATLPEKGALDFRRLHGVGTLLRGEPLTLELSDEQVASLRGKGIDVEPLKKPKKKDADPTVEREGDK